MDKNKIGLLDQSVAIEVTVQNRRKSVIGHNGQMVTGVC
jgi:hypothetical protein